VGDLEIVSVDSMQVYRGMDIGTATPTREERSRVPHHLVDLVEPYEEFTVADHQAAARTAMAEIEARGRRALLVGGSALHLRAVVDALDLPGRYPEVVRELAADTTPALHQRLVELDPGAADRIEPSNRRRLLRALEVTIGSGRPFSSFGPGLDQHPPTDIDLVGLWLPRSVVRRRIAERYRAQMAAGYLAEVTALEEGERPPGRTASQALGYRELGRHVRGELSLEDALAQAITRTRRFARRQRMWFRRDPRIRWLVTAAVPAALPVPDGRPRRSGVAARVRR
jgi:tRNA dimethylallyltransferase